MSPVINRLATITLASILLAITSSGCSNTLATGYKPRLLGDSDIRRRAYYADQFTTQAKAAEQEQKSETEQRKPKAGY